MRVKKKRLLSIAIIVLAVGFFATHNAGAIYGAKAGLHVKDGGNIGVGTSTASVKLEVAGNVNATSFLYSSDRRLKENIKPIVGLENVLKLQGVSFDWKESGDSSVGLVAQDVEAVLPELVSTNSITGLKSVQYANLVAVLIEAVKELKTENNAIKEKNEQIKRKLTVFETRQSAIEELLLVLSTGLPNERLAKLSNKKINNYTHSEMVLGI